MFSSLSTLGLQLKEQVLYCQTRHKNTFTMYIYVHLSFISTALLIPVVEALMLNFKIFFCSSFVCSLFSVMSCLNGH